ncbi:membrane protease YdiL (CAAX protease family) [Salirhabdus euzebyi]|uniref:Membrane protease YdiL (CAAX protease family) n=1 Tax=Salirhabdus euzebyi TaxID=394506 RepID=A0A841PV70_9BACI|nr:hypothetical protein [Salirhabdus euzebyi]MBB6452779.1 membrane protease YdiL (CAAX protease family) [Salirhabdus euzebyi]
MLRKSLRRFLLYLFLTISLLTIVFWGYKIPLVIHENLKFEAPLMILTIYSLIFPIFIGMMFRLPTLIKEIKDKKKWAIDWIKLSAIGIPSLYISQIYLLYFSFPSVSFPFGAVLIRNYDIPLATISGIIFGYIVLDSLKEN